MMANAEHAELKSSLSEENEASQSLTELETNTQTLEEVNAMAPSFGDEKCFLVEGAEGTETQDKRIMDEKISPIERQLEYLLNKADEFQTQLLWSRECLQNYGFAHVVPMFLQTCQPYFTYLESTARNSNPFRPPLSTYIRTQLLQFSQQLCSRLEQLVLLYASFSFFSLEESDPLSYFLCCEDVIEAADDKDGDGRCEGENTETERESRVERIWSIGRWIQTYPDPDTEDITDWVLCSVPCGQYKQLLCLGSEEPSSCTATDCLMGVLLSQETDGTFGMKT
ncbi:UPF0575 protein C19orf67 homolog isoform X4 [Sinocyclocheilus rhinocerous]|uniref:UPF0575 protein C19orf67 homolog isoform X4 n=1 Tax=Sinocyclocheilus rhinocerous TaxID=307959 RepID=UPI0007B87194|nr:PREDICTED: UPF0575 protein C19orf67 homolog isoform X4 [Sinocyclocheilus rhinocerous]